MEEEGNQQSQDIDSMKAGEYYILRPAWRGQRTVLIYRPEERQSWIFISEYPKKTKIKEMIQILLICGGLIVLGLFAFRYGYLSKTLLYLLVGLGVLGPIMFFLINQKRTVIECDPWNIKLSRRDVFKSIKGKWKSEEMEGFEFEECGDSAPATCSQIVYDLKLQLKDGQAVTLLNWQAHSNLSWIAEGLHRILGLDLKTAEGSSGPYETTDSPDAPTVDIETIEEKIRALPKPDSLNLLTNVIEKEDEDEEEASIPTKALQIVIQRSKRRLYKVYKPLAILFFVTALAVCISLIFVAAESEIQSEILRQIIVLCIVFVTVLLIIPVAFLWDSASELQHRRVKFLIYGHSVRFWSGRHWLEINLKELQQISVVSTNTAAYYVGLGIANRKWLSFGKTYAIEMRTRENMTTRAEVPFDRPECEWICTLLEEIKKSAD